jgi:hypothetical protein
MSGVQDESFGINSDAYHVPKQVILDWMNDEFQVSTIFDFFLPIYLLMIIVCLAGSHQD